VTLRPHQLQDKVRDLVVVTMPVAKEAGMEVRGPYHIPSTGTHRIELHKVFPGWYLPGEDAHGGLRYSTARLIYSVFVQDLDLQKMSLEELAYKHRDAAIVDFERAIAECDRSSWIRLLEELG
jgi:hypothetical protein